MMVALLPYSYAIGERASRRLERRCCEDIAFRVICANRVPDHATIARFQSPPLTSAGRHLHRHSGAVRQGGAGVGRAGGVSMAV
jgi:transposase